MKWDEFHNIEFDLTPHDFIMPFYLYEQLLKMQKTDSDDDEYMRKFISDPEALP